MHIVTALLNILSLFSILISATQIPVGNSPAPAHDFHSPDPAVPFVCEHPPYKTHLVSASPLVIYLENFITPAERVALLQAAPPFISSSVTTGNTTTQNTHRTSSSTSLPPSSLISCIHARALAFQSFSLPPSYLEPLQLVHYAPGQHYSYHTDWFTNPTHTTVATGGNRASSFFGYIRADNLIGGGTQFPVVKAPPPLSLADEEKWCRFVECDREWEEGVTFRAVEGNVVYWENLVEAGDGRRVGDQRTVHAGLPVVAGEKVGMNIWTREAPIGKGVRGY